MMVKKNIEKLHTFVIPAYGESPYLEDCIRSLIEQRLSSGILMVTSTPNQYISCLSQKYQIPLYINHGEAGISGDWNFGISQVHTPLFTIAHQDDIYLPEYSSRILEEYRRVKKPIIFFTDYWELRNDEVVKKDKLLNVKRLMLKPLEPRYAWNSKWWRRRVLSFGDPICCPSVTYVTDRLPAGTFRSNLKANLDWQAWESLSKLEGAFVYIKEPLMEHRVHSGSTTNKILESNARGKEDLYMLEKFWPKPVARLIDRLYSTNEKSAKA